MKHKALISTLAGAGIVAAALALAMGPLAPAASAATVKPSGMATHNMGIKGAAKNVKAATVPLTYGGGPVETTPAVYITYWGSQWSTGFSTGGYTSAQAQTYMQDFFSNVGGSSWDNIDTQYCQGVATGTINCGTAGTHVTNPTGQLKGVWTDTSTLPNAHHAGQHRRRGGEVGHALRRLQPQRDLLRLHPDRSLDERLQHVVVRLALLDDLGRQHHRLRLHALHPRRGDELRHELRQQHEQLVRQWLLRRLLGRRRP